MRLVFCEYQTRWVRVNRSDIDEPGGSPSGKIRRRGTSFMASLAQVEPFRDETPTILMISGTRKLVF